MNKVGNIIAKIFNVLFHPLMLPIYILLILTIFNSIIKYFFSTDSLLLLYSFVFITAVIIPLICYLLLRKSKFYQLTSIKNNYWMSFFLIIEAIIYYAIFKSLTSISMPLMVNKFFMLNSLFLVVFSIISLICKLDFHSIALGEILGLYIRLLRIGLALNRNILLIIILIIGIVGSSRIKLHEHLALQYHVGVIVGGAIIFFLYI